MKNKIIKLDCGIETTERPMKVFRVSNGKTESRAFRDFYESPYKAGDEVDIYRALDERAITVYNGDIIIRRAGTNKIC